MKDNQEREILEKKLDKKLNDIISLIGELK